MHSGAGGRAEVSPAIKACQSYFRMPKNCTEPSILEGSAAAVSDYSAMLSTVWSADSV